MNPVGLVETPPGFRAAPRRYPPALRLAAALLLLVFPAVVVVTTVASLAAYCLTSHAGIPFALP